MEIIIPIIIIVVIVFILLVEKNRVKSGVGTRLSQEYNIICPYCGSREIYRPAPVGDWQKRQAMGKSWYCKNCKGYF